MHIKKRVTFHGVDYILVPVELWETGKDWVRDQASAGGLAAMEYLDACREYEGTEELTDE